MSFCVETIHYILNESITIKEDEQQMHVTNLWSLQCPTFNTLDIFTCYTRRCETSIGDLACNSGAALAKAAHNVKGLLFICTEFGSGIKFPRLFPVRSLVKDWLSRKLYSFCKTVCERWFGEFRRRRFMMHGQNKHTVTESKRLFRFAGAVRVNLSRKACVGFESSIFH